MTPLAVVLYGFHGDDSSLPANTVPGFIISHCSTVHHHPSRQEHAVEFLRFACVAVENYANVT